MNDMTDEISAACAARAAALALDELARKLRTVGTPDAMQHAYEAVAAARIARGWARVLDRKHREKTNGAVTQGVDLSEELK
jgi:hypothetical protein